MKGNNFRKKVAHLLKKNPKRPTLTRQGFANKDG